MAQAQDQSIQHSRACLIYHRFHASAETTKSSRKEQDTIRLPALPCHLTRALCQPASTPFPMLLRLSIEATSWEKMRKDTSSTRLVTSPAQTPNFKNTWTFVLYYVHSVCAGPTAWVAILTTRDAQRDTKTERHRATSAKAANAPCRDISATNSTQPQPRPPLRPLKETANKWAMKWMHKFV